MKTLKIKLNIVKSVKPLLGLAIMTVLFAACKKENPKVDLPKPKAEKIEIGPGNNKRGLIGRDFHFNADITAVTKIKDVEIKILQRAGEKYASQWKFELSWPQYAGNKNSNVHKHFTIPAIAPEGKYDFYFLVTDEDGSKLELKENFIIADPEKIPVDPKIGRHVVSRNGTAIYNTNNFVEKELVFKKGDKMTLQAQVNEIKGDGILYSVLVKKKSNYSPESVDNLDFTKVIVVSKTEHKALPGSSRVTTSRMIDGLAGGESIVVGDLVDGNQPSPSAISGEKSWESGQYYWIILYKNTSHNMSVYKSIPITINY